MNDMYVLLAALADDVARDGDGHAVHAQTPQQTHLLEDVQLLRVAHRQRGLLRLLLAVPGAQKQAPLV